jgi:predicted Zn-dependent protease
MKSRVEKHKTSVWHRFIYIVIPFLLAAGIIMQQQPSFAAYKVNPEEEIRIGTEAAAEVEKESKIIDDEALNARVQAVGNAIASVANTKEIKATYGDAAVSQFNYTFKIVDDKDINAFSLPGGFIYVNKGLLDYVQSDDELAGVIAHEIAHAAHHHAMFLMKSQDKQMMATAIGILLAAGLGAKSGDLGNLAQAAQLVSVAKLSAYGQKAEFDADRTAVHYMAGTKYNPAGMLTFMERLARDEIRKPQITYGIFATHPPAQIRAKQIIDEMNKLNLPINRRLVTTYMKVNAKPVPDSSAYALSITDVEIMKVTSTETECAENRANRIAEELGQAFIEGARMNNVRLGNNNTSVVIMGKTIITPTESDAELAGMSVEELTKSASNAIKRAMLNELLEQSI